MAAFRGCWNGCASPTPIPGVLASALAMDKEKTKDVYRAAGLPVVDSLLADKAAIRAAHVMAPPYVVKPYNEGSSVGVYIVPEGANAPPAVAEDMPDLLMVEAYAPGRELTVSVLGEAALGVTEILTDGWYDYEAKYAPGGSRHVCPGPDSARDRRGLPRPCPARPSGAGLSRAVAHRFPLG